MKKTVISILTALFVNIGLYANQVVYLSPTGSDEGKGTIDAPYYSLNKAIEGLLDNQSGTDTLFIKVAAGNYYMDRPFVIDRPSSRPIVIQSDEATDKPCFIGGVSVKGWQKHGDKLYRAYVPEVVRYGLEFEQLFVNGKRAILARTPNEDWFYVKNSSETLFVEGGSVANYATQRINFNREDWEGMSILPVSDLQHLKFRFYHKWDITHKRAAYVDTDSAYIYMNGAGMKSWNPVQKGSRYIMYDYRAALDVPGEWYLDRELGYLYYMPLEGEEMESVECFVPSLEQLVVFRGKEDQPIKHVSFENISFQYSAYVMPEKGEEPAQAAAYVKAALTFDFAENINMRNCEVLHTGLYAIWFRQECHNNRVEHCYLADLGAGGIKIGEPYFRQNNRKVSSGHFIHNNIITHVGRELPCGIGVAIFHSSDNEVSHNEISDLYYSGISVGWVWGYNTSSIKSSAVRNTISYNHIHHIGWGELSDMGAVYTLGESGGTKVTNNVIHDVLSYDYGGWGLYTDEGSTGVEMSNNLVYRCKSGGFHQHYGKENKIENNIFAFGYYYQAQYTRAESHLSFYFKHNIILQEQGETLAGAWETGLLDIDFNLYWHLNGEPKFGKYTFKEWKKLKEPHSVYADPMFKAPLSDDYTFLSSKAVRKIGFKPFDYSKAGVYGEKNWVEKARLSQETLDDFKQKSQQRLNK